MLLLTYKVIEHGNCCLFMSRASDFDAAVILAWKAFSGQSVTDAGNADFDGIAELPDDFIVLEVGHVLKFARVSKHSGLDWQNVLNERPTCGP